MKKINPDLKLNEAVIFLLKLQAEMETWTKKKQLSKMIDDFIYENTIFTN